MFKRLVSNVQKQARCMSVLVVADVQSSKLAENVRNVVSAASKMDNKVDILVCGNGVADAAKQASKLSGVSSVLLCENAVFANQVAETTTQAIVQIQQQNKYTHIIAASTASGKNILPRVAAKLDVQPIADIIEVKSADTFVRPIYAGNVLSTVQSTDATKVVTVRPTGFDKTSDASSECPVVNVSVNVTEAKTQWVKDEVIVSERPELTGARVVVSGGRGLKSAENFKIVETLADSLSAAVGASRAAVDAGYCPNDYQVGQTGKVVAPELYIAVGISGAIQHVAGMKDSKTIVAINKDPEAPIFQISDFGLVADLFTAVPELTQKVKK